MGPMQRYRVPRRASAFAGAVSLCNRAANYARFFRVSELFENGARLGRRPAAALETRLTRWISVRLQRLVEDDTAALRNHKAPFLP